MHIKIGKHEMTSHSDKFMSNIYRSFRIDVRNACMRAMKFNNSAQYATGGKIYKIQNCCLDACMILP